MIFAAWKTNCKTCTLEFFSAYTMQLVAAVFIGSYVAMADAASTTKEFAERSELTYRLKIAQAQSDASRGESAKDPSNFTQIVASLADPAKQEFAAAELVGLARTSPTFAPAHFMLGLIAEGKEDWDAAAMHMCKAVLIDPYSDLGTIATEKIRTYSRCKELDANEESRGQRQYGGSLLFALGLLDLGQFENAFRESSHAAALAPERWEPYYIAALALAANAQPDDARRFLSKAIEFAPAPIGDLIRKELEPNQSAAPTQQAPTQETAQPTSVPLPSTPVPDKSARVMAQFNALAEAGRTAFEKGNYADAAHNLKQVWALDPNDEGIGLMLASASIFAHDYITAREVLTTLASSKNRRTRKEVSALRKQLEDAESKSQKPVSK